MLCTVTHSLVTGFIETLGRGIEFRVIYTDFIFHVALSGPWQNTIMQALHYIISILGNPVDPSSGKAVTRTFHSAAHRTAQARLVFHHFIQLASR